MKREMTPEQVFAMVAEYGDDPSSTASGMTGGQWAQAWLTEWQRANRAEAALEEFPLVPDVPGYKGPRPVWADWYDANVAPLRAASAAPGEDA